MPTYEYYCEANNQTIEVLHGMNETVSTWGELCATVGIELGGTQACERVERKLSAVSLLPKKGEGPRGGSGGCCGGGGCGCSGN
jgi:predicted nucleic acid-binding Zn ribbon protein